MKATRWGSYVRLVIGMIGAIVISVMLSVYIQRDSLIAGCQRNDVSKIIDVKFYLDAASARQKTDPKVAAQYRASAQQKMDSIPLPGGFIHTYANTTNEHLRDRGCHAAYPPPIPGVE